jgi:hypothetical protein
VFCLQFLNDFVELLFVKYEGCSLSVHFLIKLVFQLYSEHVLKVIQELIVLDIFSLDLVDKSLSQLATVLEAVHDYLVGLLQ